VWRELGYGGGDRANSGSRIAERLGGYVVLVMDKKHEKSSRRDSREREEELRAAVVAADATGLVADEELITQAETMLPLPQAHSGRRGRSHSPPPSR
jgi:hypothetical protein